jgi:hypothetical protein
MKKGMFVLILTASIMGISKAQNQNDSTAYLVMKVNDAILDCPHFRGLFIKMEIRNNWKEIERNYSKKYLILSYPKNVEYDVISKFKEELTKMNFPLGVITDLYTKNTIEEIKKGME